MVQATTRRARQRPGPTAQPSNNSNIAIGTSRSVSARSMHAETQSQALVGPNPRRHLPFPNKSAPFKVTKDGSTANISKIFLW